MRGDRKPDIRRVEEAKVLVEQGSSSDDLFLLLNVVLVVEVDRIDVDKLHALAAGHRREEARQ